MTTSRFVSDGNRTIFQPEGGERLSLFRNKDGFQLRSHRGDRGFFIDIPYDIAEDLGKELMNGGKR